jgi:hypothetical protein
MDGAGGTHEREEKSISYLVGKLDGQIPPRGKLKCRCDDNVKFVSLK